MLHQICTQQIVEQQLFIILLLFAIFSFPNLLSATASQIGLQLMGSVILETAF